MKAIDLNGSHVGKVVSVSFDEEDTLIEKITYLSFDISREPEEFVGMALGDGGEEDVIVFVPADKDVEFI